MTTCKQFACLLLAVASLLYSCTDKPDKPAVADASASNYFNNDDKKVKDGGVKVIRIESLGHKFNIWTKQYGNNPSIKLLLLNGGPGATHEYFECMESYLPAEGIEFIYYDQLGCGLSDNPNDSAYWDLSRYVEEVEQVRKALNLGKDNFYLLGHSWGGMLAMQYALKYQDNMKGLIISNMMSSIPEYGKYADNVLAKQMKPEVLAQIRDIEKKKDFENPKYMELLMPNFYVEHICRIPVEQWPEPMSRSFNKMNRSLYVTMQGPSEFGVAGRLLNWDVSDSLKTLKVPTLTIGGKHDTMDPAHMQWMSKQVQNGSYLFCPNGSHMSMYDDQQTYMTGLIKFLKGVNEGNYKVSLE